MEVKPGYKKTEVGVIPEEWEALKIESIIDEISMGPFGSDIKVSNFVSSGVPVLNGANVASECLVDSFENFVSPAKAKSLKKAVARRGDIVVTHRGTIGQISYIPEDSAFDRYVVSQSQFRVRFAQDHVIPAWVVLYFYSDSGAKRWLEGKGHTGVPAIAQPTRTFRHLSVPVPPLPEQRAIATALSDVDVLLGGLDRLIAKKRDLKQAAMQQLLIGQTRLPGFHDKWEVKRLGDLAEIVSGGTPKTTEPAYWNGGIKWCTPTDITGCMGKYLTETERTISRLGLQNSGARILPAGALLLCSRATIGQLKIAGGEICTNQGFKSLVCTPSVTHEFLYYKLLTMKQKMVERSFGSTFLEISKGNVAVLEVDTPSLPEQCAIAAVLSDMDAELAALEARRDKTCDLKQAMMQELLTGRIRLA